MLIPETRTRDIANAVENPECSIELTESNLVHLRTSNGHTVQFEPRVFYENMTAFCRALSLIRNLNPGAPQ